MSPLRTILAVASLSLAAVASAQVSIKPWKPENQLNWSVLTSGTQSRFQQQAFQVISSENDLQTYWRASTGQAPETAPKGVNWMKEKLVAVHLGQRTSGGYSVVVQNVAKNGTYATVYAVERTPAKGQWVTQALTSPWVIIRVDRAAAQLGLDLKQQQGGSTGGVTVYGPGLFQFNPSNYDRQGGGGFVDPKFQTDWTVYRSGGRSRIPQSGLHTVNTLPEWQNFWSRLTGNPAGTAPGGIDWLKHRLVVLTLGERPTTGFGIDVVNVEKRGVYGVIRAVEIIPVPGARVRERKVSPYIVIKVPRDLVQFNVDVTQREGNGDLRYNDGL